MFRLLVVASCGLWTGAAGCKGAEHVVLAPFAEAVDRPMGGAPGAGTGGSSPMDGGNSQAIDASDRERDAGDAAIDSGPDPNVTFEWDETPPGAGTCGANTFAGIFSCALEGRPTAAAIIGRITLEVAASETEGAKLMVTGQLSTDFFLTAQIEGWLDCGLNELEAEGTALFGGGFETTMTGMYDPETSKIVGELTMVNQALEVCVGSFEASEPL